MRVLRTRLVTKLLFIAMVCISAIAVVAAVAGWSDRRITSLQEAQDAGLELLLQTNRVHGRLKDLMFDMFSPQTYGLLKDLIHVPRASHLLSTFDADVELLRTQYDRFFESEAVQSLLTDERMLRDYNAAIVIGHRAFEDITRLQQALERIETDAPIRGEGLYRWVVLADLPDTETFLQDVRSVSYYFSDTFERLLVHVIYRLNEHSDILQERTLTIFWITTLIAAFLAFMLPLLFAAQLTRRLFRFQQAVERLGEGDFHIRALEGAEDEVGRLLRRFNTVAEKLSRNIDSVSLLMQRVGRRMSESPTRSSLLELIAETTAEHEHIEAVAIVETRMDGRHVLAGSARNRPLEPLAFVTAIYSLPARSQPNLELQVQARSDSLSDLDRVHLRILGEYATLLIDHNDVYRELIERRQAVYHALQAQIQPHFLFNVLGGMFGLNRSGDAQLVERSLICLRDMLQYIVSERDVVTLEDEFAFTRVYLELQMLRFGDRLTTDISLYDSVAGISMPKLGLQPLVENAVIHGIEPKVGPSTIHVAATMDADDAIMIRIEDDGVGTAAGSAVHERTSTVHQSEGLGLHIGISNVQSRLSLMYPEAHLSVSDRPGGGTRVTIVIPRVAAERSRETLARV